MDVPADVDDAFALFNQKASELDAALAATEAEQAAGRSGYKAYMTAHRLAEELNRIGAKVAALIEEARRNL